MDVLIRIAPIVLLLIAGRVSAQSPLDESTISSAEYRTVDKATLTVSPTACALEDEKRLCEMDVAVVWEVPAAGDYCLYYQNTEAPLRCWQQEVTGAMRYKFSDGKDGEFFLISNQNTIEARARIRVIGAIEQQLRARRRSGFWRIF